MKYKPMNQSAQVRWVLGRGEKAQRIRDYNPHMITDVCQYWLCGEWAPTTTEEYLQGRRRGTKTTWGILIEVTDEDYEKWPQLIEGYPDGRDLICYRIHDDGHVEEPDIERYDIKLVKV